jgi:hypothetical protein
VTIRHTSVAAAAPVEFAKSISSTCHIANRSEKVQTRCHPYGSVVLAPVSANCLHENGNFYGYFRQILAKVVVF